MNNFEIIFNNLVNDFFSNSNLLLKQYNNDKITIEQNEISRNDFYLEETNERLNIENEYFNLFYDFEIVEREIKGRERDLQENLNKILNKSLAEKKIIINKSFSILDKIYISFIDIKNILSSKCTCHYKSSNNISLFNNMLSNKTLRFCGDNIECSLCNKLFIREFYGSDFNSICSKLNEAFV
jgi:hypothetical protein